MKRIFVFLLVILFSFPVFADEKETKIKIYTTAGKITVKLYNDTPLHRDNFIKLVQENQYDSIMFHRVIKLFMIQAGEKYAPVDSARIAKIQELEQKEQDIRAKKKIRRLLSKVGINPIKKQVKKLTFPFDPNYKAPANTIPAEIIYPKYFHKRGQLCAARTSDEVNPERKSSAFQFYIVTGKHFTENELDKMEKLKNKTFTPEQRQAYMFEGGAPHLDGEYTTFGEVTKGLKIVQKIELSPTDYFDRPLRDIRIKKMKILKK